ncbi:Protein of unknown function (DUF2628) [Hoeflea phototrophica DFL-43]|jgi:hypothetical protein|uniref:DUF2628 domain-containing protein n=1 Tax=Hoeflea phototrophica (strain DSM 17068 / NCIMB 14078 / DFL-43) TaxID=411684 RepID=A9CUT8_HOEPD|nr:DUF2628 domain-containing protein [Hoeflea phototrophica]EDQ35271.1 Protein of unknown function (DUF2628) [Hoeflea phototrophica DFL-43]
MSCYLVFARPGAPVPDEGSVIVADRFAPWAFAFPMLWLLFNRLWIEAAIAFALSLASTMMITNPALFWPGLALGVALSAVTAMEGRNWRAAALVRRGWQMIDLIEADDADAAFEIHALRASGGKTVVPGDRPTPPRNFPQPGRADESDAGTIGLVPVQRS